MEQQQKSRWPFRILIASLVSLVIGSVLLLSQMDTMDAILDPRDNNIAVLNTQDEVQTLVEIDDPGCYRAYGVGFDGNVTLSELDGSVIGDPLSESKCKLDWQAMANDGQEFETLATWVVSTKGDYILQVECEGDCGNETIWLTSIDSMEEGIISSYKFIQKLWNLNEKIDEQILKDHKNDNDIEIKKYTNKFLKKITNNLENFSYNKIIANLHEMYSFMYKQLDKPYTKKTIRENYQKILIAMTPIIPHFSTECLDLLNVKDFDWTRHDESMLKEDIVNIVIQVNGKKRGLIKTKPNLSEEKLFEIIKNDETLTKHINQKNVKRKIYIQNKLMNIII